MKLFQDDLGDMLKLYTASFVGRGPKGYDITGCALGGVWSARNEQTRVRTVGR